MKLRERKGLKIWPFATPRALVISSIPHSLVVQFKVFHSLVHSTISGKEDCLVFFEFLGFE